MTNLAAAALLPGLLWVLAAFSSLLVRPWTDRIGAVLVGLRSGGPEAASNPVSLLISVAVMIPPSAALLTWLVLWLTARLRYPARLGPSVGLLLFAWRGWEVAGRFPLPASVPPLAQRPPLWAHAGLELQVMAALTAVPAVALLSWLAFRETRSREKPLWHAPRWLDRLLSLPGAA